MNRIQFYSISEQHSLFLVFLGFMFLGKCMNLYENFEYNKILLILNRRAGFPFINISHTLQVVTEPDNLTVMPLFTICRLSSFVH